MKAVPFFLIVKQYAFLTDLPFFTLKQMRAAMSLYKQSIEKAANYEG